MADNRRTGSYRDRQTDRELERQTDRQRARETDRQRDGGGRTTEVQEEDRDVGLHPRDRNPGTQEGQGSGVRG